MLERWRILAGVAVAAVLLWWLARSPAVPVAVAGGSEGPLPVRGGMVEIRERGARVAAGDVALRIDDGPVSAELAKAHSERLAAQESLREARSALVRIRQHAATDDKLFAEAAITRE